MFPAPPVIETRVFARLPDRFRRPGGAPWLAHNRAGEPLDSFLEGPSFDRDGNLYVVDIPFGRVFRVDGDGAFELVVEYDGEPNGLKVHRDGRLFVADHKNGILVIDPATGRIAPVLDRPHNERFRGVNDLFFAANGDLYFTDQGQSGLHDPSGRVFRHRDGRLELLIGNVPSPNGLVLTDDGGTLLVAVTRDNAVWRLPLVLDGMLPTKVGAFLRLSGGSGPDGLAMDTAGNLAVCHPGLGAVWLFSPRGEPLHRVQSCAGDIITNCAYGGDDGRTLFITDSRTGSILTARMPEPGSPMYGLS